jgi:hypothetical protein
LSAQIIVLAHDAVRCCQGNELYKRYDFVSAVWSYNNAFRWLPNTDECAALRSILYFNRAQNLLQFAHQHLGEEEEVDGEEQASTISPAQAAIVYRALYDCSRSLACNPQYVKARVMRAELLARTEQWAAAVADFQQLKGKPPPPLQRAATCNFAELVFNVLKYLCFD